MKEKITLVIYAEYDSASLKDIPSGARFFLEIDKYCFRIASLFGKVRNRGGMRVRFRRDVIDEIPDIVPEIPEG